MTDRRCLVAAVLAATGTGCGRIGFDPNGDGGAAGDGPGPGGLHLLSVQGDGDDSGHGVDVGAGGEIAIAGDYTQMLFFGEASWSSTATTQDMFAATWGPAGVPRSLWTGMVSTFAVGDSVAWRGEDLVVAGYFAGTLAGAGGITSASGQDVVLATVDGNGALLDARQFGGGSNVQIRSLDASPSGRIAIGGIYMGSFDLGGPALPATADDNGYLAVFDPPIARVWDRAWNAAGEVWPNAVALTADGGLCVAGRIYASADLGTGVLAGSTPDAVVARYEPDGTPRWARRIGGPGGELATSVGATSDGGCVAGGAMDDSFTLDGMPVPAVTGALDGWIARFEPAAGGAMWARTIVTGPGVDRLIGLAIDGSDRIVAAMAFEGTATVAGDNLASEGFHDVAIVGLGPDGSRIWHSVIGGPGEIDAGTRVTAAIAPGGARFALGLRFQGTIRLGTEEVAALGAGGETGVAVIDLAW